MKYLSSVLLTTASVVLAGGLVAGSASAAGIGFSTSAGDNTYGAFDDGTAPGYTFEAPGPVISLLNNIVAPPTLENNYAVPLGDTSNYLAVQPGIGTVDKTLRGAILYTSEALLSTFSIYWGSADASNMLEFYNGSTLIQAITGSDVFGANANGNQFSTDSNKYVTFNADANSKFNKIRFSTGHIAFEFDQKRAVPVPAVVPGIALAAAFFGSKALKRNKKNAGEVVA